MGTVLDEFAGTRGDSRGKLHVSLSLSRLAYDSLTGAGDQVEVGFESALRCYMADRESNRPAWPYPGFLRGSDTREEVSVECEVEPDLWREFEAEASRQDVTVAQLAEHAVFYFAAEMDAGRFTERIVEDLGADGDS